MEKKLIGKCCISMIKLNVSHSFVSTSQIGLIFSLCIFDVKLNIWGFGAVKNYVRSEDKEIKMGIFQHFMNKWIH